MNQEWLVMKINELTESENEKKIEILEEICGKLEFDSLETDESVYRNLLTCPAIFACLDTENEKSSVATDILTICMSRLNLNENTLNFTQLLEKSLKHRNPKVQMFALREISKMLEKQSSENYKTIFDDQIILSVLGCLTSCDTQIGGPAIAILSKVLPHIMIDEPDVSANFMEFQKHPDSIVKTRFYEIAVNIAKNSPQDLKIVQPAIEKLISEIDGDDILLQMNVLELLVSLSEQNHGLIFMEEKKIFKKMCHRIKNLEGNALDRFLIPGYMKFFGKIAFNQPKRIIEGYPNMISCLFDCLKSNNINYLPTAFDTLSNLTHLTEGKILLDVNYSERMKETLEIYAHYIKHLPTAMKNRTFNSLEEIFRLEGPPNNQILTITKKWCSYLVGSTTNINFLLQFCSNPFPDIKVSCLCFIKTLITYDWAQEALKNTAGFLEYLLDRRVEFDKEAKCAKFEINKILSESTIMDANSLILLKKYVNEGPYYVQGVVDVATENS